MLESATYVWLERGRTNLHTAQLFLLRPGIIL